MNPSRILVLVVAAGMSFAAAATDTIRIIVPSPAGGLSDSFARALAAPLREQTGLPVIVDNRAGASMMIGMQACEQGNRDGNTLCLAPPDALSYNPNVFSKLPYNPSGFIGISNLGWTNGVIVVSTKSGITSFRQLVELSKAEPDKINWATWGDASMPDVFLRWINRSIGTRIVGIPYKGAAPAIQSILAGETQVTYMGIGQAEPHIKAGLVRPIALTDSRRGVHYPELPTLAELGADPELPGYFGLYAPPGTPPAAAKRMNGYVERALETAELRRFLATYTLRRAPMTSVQFTTFLKQDRERPGKVFRELGFKQVEAAVQ